MSNDFVEALEKSQQVPESMGGGADVDPAGFDVYAPEGVKHVTEVKHPKEPVRLDFTADRAVIKIYDPTVGEITDGLERYREIMNKILYGDYVLRSEKETMMPDGSIIVSVSWMIPVDIESKEDLDEEPLPV